MVAYFEDSWLLVEFWSDFEQTCTTESFLELTSKAQLGWSTADSTLDESDVWLQRSDGHSGLSELMSTEDKSTEVSLHDERDKTDSEELIDKSFFFKVIYLVFGFEVWKDEDEWSDVWPDSFFELQELNESENFAESISSWSDVWTNSFLSD